MFVWPGQLVPLRLLSFLEVSTMTSTTFKALPGQSLESLFTDWVTAPKNASMWVGSGC